MSSWRECKLGEVAEIKTGKSNAQDSILNGIYPLFDRSQIIKQSNRFLFDDEAIIVAGEGKEFTPRYFSGKFDLHQRAYAVHKIIKAVPKFIFYAIWSNKEYFKSVAVGSTVMSLRLNHFTEFPLLLPPLEEQKAIAEVLSSLDDKIDLLHRQNKTLEELAETLFRQWFIEEVKEEWEEKPLSKIADFLNGLACQKFPPQNDIDKLPVLKIKDLKDGISENSDYATSNVKPEYIVNNGDVIFAWSASLMVKIWDGEQCVLNQHLFKVTSKDFPKWFYYHWCKYHLDNFIAISSAHATTMGHIKRGDLDEAMCVIPSSEELVKMDDEISPIFEKIETNSRQIKSLEKMRDTLLPKLLSGEVRVEI